MEFSEAFLVGRLGDTITLRTCWSIWKIHIPPQTRNFVINLFIGSFEVKVEDGFLTECGGHDFSCAFQIMRHRYFIRFDDADASFLGIFLDVSDAESALLVEIEGGSM